jgi:hypothetical protein
MMRGEKRDFLLWARESSDWSQRAWRVTIALEHGSQQAKRALTGVSPAEPRRVLADIVTTPLGHARRDFTSLPFLLSSIITCLTQLLNLHAVHSLPCHCAERLSKYAACTFAVTSQVMPLQHNNQGQPLNISSINVINYNPLQSHSNRPTMDFFESHIIHQLIIGPPPSPDSCVTI